MLIQAGASMGPLDHHALCVAAEQHNNVQIYSIAPSIIDTQMQAHIRAAECEAFPMLDKFKALYRNRNLSHADDIAAMIAQMISQANGSEKTLKDVRDS